MKFPGIIFDFNGTLFQDSDLVEESWRMFAGKLRKEPLTSYEINTIIHGRPNKYINQYLSGRIVGDDELKKNVDEKESIYRNICLSNPDRLKLVPGSIELLDFLKDKGFRRTIATSAEISNVDFFFKVFRLDKWFDKESIVYDDGTHLGKPEPDVFIKAAQRLSLRPDECIVVEDALSGIESARRAGAGHIIAIGPDNKHEEFKRIPGVKSVIADFKQFDYNLLEI